MPNLQTACGTAVQFRNVHEDTTKYSEIAGGIKGHISEVAIQNHLQDAVARDFGHGSSSMNRYHCGLWQRRTLAHFRLQAFDFGNSQAVGLV